MHFILFVKLYPICPCMNRHFWNMYSHPVDMDVGNFGLRPKDHPSLEWYFERQCSARQLSWVVQLLYVIIDDILVIGICDGTCNILVYRWTKDQIWPTRSIGLPRLTHSIWHFIWVRPSTVPGTVGSAFSVLAADPLYHIMGFNKQPKYYL